MKFITDDLDWSVANRDSSQTKKSVANNYNFCRNLEKDYRLLIEQFKHMQLRAEVAEANIDRLLEKQYPEW